MSDAEDMSDIADDPVSDIEDAEDIVSADDIDAVIDVDSDSGSDDGSDSEPEIPQPQSQPGYRRRRRVPPAERVTRSVLTISECAQVIATRAQQIDAGGRIYTDYAGLTDSKQIALKELYDRKCPLSVQRQMSDADYEEWAVNEMGLPDGFRENNRV